MADETLYKKLEFVFIFISSVCSCMMSSLNFESQVFRECSNELLLMSLIPFRLSVIPAR